MNQLRTLGLMDPGVMKGGGFLELLRMSASQGLFSTEFVRPIATNFPLLFPIQRFCSCCRNVVTDALDDLLVSDDSDEDKVSFVSDII